MESKITKVDEKQNDGTRAFADEAVQVDTVEKDEAVEIHDLPGSGLIYGVLDTPPIHITIICGLQVRF